MRLSVVCVFWVGVFSRQLSLSSCSRSRKFAMSATEAPQEKKQCVQKTIGTHNGNFHCDDVLACYMLRILQEYEDARIVRSRDKKVLDECDVVVDVGGVYDPAIHRYDHHQKTFDGTMHNLTDGKKPWVTKLSSAGLVYLHFGHRIVARIADLAVDSEVTGELYDKIYENFIEEVDAIDNGIACNNEPMRYKVTTNLSSRVSYLNPSWNSDQDNYDEMFGKAMEMVGAEFRDRIMALKNIWLPARGIVQSALEKRHQIHESGAVLHLERACPWKDHLFELEKALNIQPEIKFVLYTDQNGKYRVQCVPVTPSSFANRLSLLEAWRGLRDEVLSQQSGIEGCVFVHASGFIGGNETFEGALKMAVRTLEENDKEKC